MRSWREHMLALFPPSRDHRPGGNEPAPEAYPETLAVLAFHNDLGADANGNALLSEVLRALDEAGVHDPGEREAWRVWLRSIDGATARFRRQQIEAASADRRSGNRLGD